MKQKRIPKKKKAGVEKPAMKRLARRAGVVRVSGGALGAMAALAKIFLQEPVHNAALLAEHARKRTLKARDVAAGLQRAGHPIVGI